MRVFQHLLLSVVGVEVSDFDFVLSVVVPVFGCSVDEGCVGLVLVVMVKVVVVVVVLVYLRVEELLLVVVEAGKGVIALVRRMCWFRFFGI